MDHVHLPARHGVSGVVGSRALRFARNRGVEHLDAQGRLDESWLWVYAPLGFLLVGMFKFGGVVHYKPLKTARQTAAGFLVFGLTGWMFMIPLRGWFEEVPAHLVPLEWLAWMVDAGCSLLVPAALFAVAGVKAWAAARKEAADTRTLCSAGIVATLGFVACVYVSILFPKINSLGS